MFKRIDIPDHVNFCDYMPLHCEAYPKCKQTILRKDYFDHVSDCLEVKVICPDLCGEYVKRKYMPDGNHDCITYLTTKLKQKRDKIKYLKQESKYQTDIDMLNSNC